MEEKENKVQLNVFIPREQRDILRRIAIKRMNEDPSRSYTASGIAAEIFETYLDDFLAKEAEHEYVNHQN